MPAHSTVELSDLVLNTRIGTYGPEDVVPEAHLLDLSLTIDPSLVLIEADDMASVFDYDPLVRQIDVLARDGHYVTQERLMTRIVAACAACAEVCGLVIHLRKRPVLGQSGVLGVRLELDDDALAPFRRRD
jgi:dihydroneopterin aldolase